VHYRATDNFISILQVFAILVLVITRHFFQQSGLRKELGLHAVLFYVTERSYKAQFIGKAISTALHTVQ